MTTITDRPPVEVRGWVLYDDACGFCRSWIPFWSWTLAKRGFAADPEADPQARYPTWPDGSQVRGADVASMSATGRGRSRFYEIISKLFCN